MKQDDRSKKREAQEKINTFDAIILKEFLPHDERFSLEEIVAAWGGYESAVRHPDANWKFRFLVNLTGVNPIAIKNKKLNT